jgi:hypothetical protein
VGREHRTVAQKLESDFAIQLPIAGAIDLTHADPIKAKTAYPPTLAPAVITMVK